MRSPSSVGKSTHRQFRHALVHDEDTTPRRLAGETHLAKDSFKVRMHPGLSLGQPCRIDLDKTFYVDFDEKVSDRGEMDRASIFRLLEYRGNIRKLNHRWSLRNLGQPFVLQDGDERVD